MAFIWNWTESFNYNITFYFVGVGETGEAPEESNIHANIRKKLEIVSRHTYGDRKKLFDKKSGGEKSRDTSLTG